MSITKGVHGFDFEHLFCCITIKTCKYSRRKNTFIIFVASIFRINQMPRKRRLDKQASKQQWMALLCILFATFLCYLPALQSEFIPTWDDAIYVLNNSQVKEFSIENLKLILSTPTAANYHPLTMLTFFFNYQLSGTNPFTYHLFNVLFHLFNVAMAFWIAWYLSKHKLWVAITTAFLFALHPMHVESVAWISERKDVLYAFFLFGALLNYLFYLQNKRAQKYYYYALALFVAALLSKAMAVVLPVLMLLIDFFRNRLYKNGRWNKKAIIEKIPFFAVALIFGLVAYGVQQKSGAVHGLQEFDFTQRIVIGAYGFWTYLVEFFVPTRMAAFHPYQNWIHQLPILYVSLPFLAIVFLGATAYSLKYSKVFFFSIFFYLISVALVLQVISVGGAVIADRYTYLAYFGLAFLLGHLLHFLFKQKGVLQYTTYIAAGLYALFMMYTTWQTCKKWENDGTLWTNVIEQYPRAWQAYTNRADFYTKQKNYPLAIADYNQVTEINLGSSDAFNNRGNIYFNQGNNELAIQDYNRAIRIDSKDFKALGNRGAIYYRLKEYDKALQDLDKALLLNSDYRDGYLNRGVIHSVVGNHAQAKADYDELIRLSPNHPLAYYWRGLAHQNMGNHLLAIEDFDQALRIKPQNAAIYFNRSQSHKQLENKTQALQDAQQAKKLGHPVEEAYIQSFFK